MARPSPLVVILMAIAVTAGACGDASTPNSRFCDVVKRVEATADPLKSPEVFSDPAGLEAALSLRVRAYTDLANVSPESLKPDAIVVRDAISAVSQALRERRFESSAANAPEVAKIIKADGLRTSESNLSRYAQSSCKERSAT